MEERKKGIAAVLVAATMWSTGGVFIKILPFEALTICFYRSVLAAGVFALLFGKRAFLMNARTAFSAACYASLLLFFVTATKLTTAANAILLQYTAPVFILLAEPILFKVKLEKVNLITILFCVLGMALFFMDQLGVGDWRGDLLALMSGVSLAAFMLNQRQNPEQYHEAAIFWGNLLVIAAGSYSFSQSQAPNLTEGAMLLYLGIFQIGLPYALFSYGLKRTFAIESALLAMAEPVLNPVWVLIGYGEVPAPTALAGGALILLSLAGRLVWLERAKRKRPNMT